jgi:hypothetical protein
MPFNRTVTAASLETPRAIGNPTGSRGSVALKIRIAYRLPPGMTRKPSLSAGTSFALSSLSEFWEIGCERTAHPDEPAIAASVMAAADRLIQPRINVPIARVADAARTDR